jgi:hypothetical protein
MYDHSGPDHNDDSGPNDHPGADNHARLQHDHHR